MRTWSRNSLRQMIGGAAGALRSVGLLDPLRRVFRRLASPELEARPVGPLSDEAAETLLAAVEALTAATIDRAHYEEFFRWRAENLPGHQALYERFSVTANRLAQRSHGRKFLECEHRTRLEILQPAFRLRAARDRLSRLRVGIFQRDWVLFDLHIVRETALLFARTDAWRLVGYEAWPATPRGLERYQTQPSNLRSEEGGSG